MSRNFEILRRAGLVDPLFPPSGDEVPPRMAGFTKREPEVVEGEVDRIEDQDPRTPEFIEEPALRAFRRHSTLDEQAHEEVVKVVQRVFVMPNSSSVPRLVIFSNVDKGSGSGEI